MNYEEKCLYQTFFNKYFILRHNYNNKCVLWILSQETDKYKPNKNLCFDSSSFFRRLQLVYILAFKGYNIFEGFLFFAVKKKSIRQVVPIYTLTAFRKINATTLPRFRPLTNKRICFRSWISRLFYYIKRI